MNEDKHRRLVRFEANERQRKCVCDRKSPSPLRLSSLKIVAKPVSFPSDDIRIKLTIIDGIKGG
jgi:hypothetical protein